MPEGLESVRQSSCMPIWTPLEDDFQSGFPATKTCLFGRDGHRSLANIPDIAKSRIRTRFLLGARTRGQSTEVLFLEIKTRSWEVAVKVSTKTQHAPGAGKAAIHFLQYRFGIIGLRLPC